MLRELEVRDLGIIDALLIEFLPGFVVLTGETGAGKSLLVQSLQLLAGERADAEQVRAGSERLLVRGCFSTPTAAAAVHALEELGVGGGGELVVRREVGAQGRSRAWINDTPVTAGTLQRLAPYLLSIHGQHEQRGLADPDTHLALLDEAGDLGEPRAEVAASFGEWLAVCERLAAQRAALATRRDRLDVIEFQVREITAGRIEGGEDERLREERALLRHAERIGELVVGARGALGEGGGAHLARAGKAVRELERLGVGVGEIAAGLEQAQLLAEEAEVELGRLADKVRFDPPRLEAVEARLALLERLAHKYGGSLAAIGQHHARLVKEREQLAAVEDEIACLEEDSRALAERYLALAQRLSARRHKAARRFCQEVERVLGALGMPRVRFELRLERRSAENGNRDDELASASEDGLDVAELWTSANPGEAPRPLARVASGGELSRIHLAVRTVLRERRRVDSLCLLFDEVDAGIGGRVADELGALLAELGRRDQVLVVTHLPPVAARAGVHFVVSKQAEGGRTVTRVQRVSGEERVGELVRMLGGDERTPAARAYARELLREA
ncbi:MAG: DNA repair protein RecN [Acidobacteriota bacterium]